MKDGKSGSDIGMRRRINPIRSPNIYRCDMHDKKRAKARGHSDASVTERGSTARNTTRNPRIEQRFPRTLDIWLLRSPLIEYMSGNRRSYSSISTVGREEAVIEFRLRVLRVMREQQLQGCSNSKADLERQHTQTRPRLP